jgi:TonB family protein
MTSFYLDSENPGNKLINARNFAIAASIGIHGLILAAIVPNMSGSIRDNPTPKDLRDVGVVELNSFERSRLPDLNPSALANVPTNDNAISALPELPPLGSLDTALPPLSSISPPPSLPSLPSLPSSYSLPPLNVYSPPTASLPSRRNFLPSYPTNLPAPPSTPTISSNTRPPSSNFRPNFDPYRDTLTPNGLRQAPRDASEQARDRLNDPVAINGTPSGDSDLARQRARTLWDEMQQRERELQADQSNTTNDEAMRNQVNWLARVKETNPGALNDLANPDRSTRGITVVSLTGNYPVPACDRKLAGTAIYGVTVNGGGAQISEPELIKSSGYPILNQQAAREVRSTRFNNPGGEGRIYQVKVSFAPTPDVCRGSIATPRNTNEAPINTRNTTPPTPEIPAPPRQQSPAVNPQPVTPEPAPKPAAVVEPKPETPPAVTTPAEVPPTTQTLEPPTEAIEPPSPPAETKPEPSPAISPSPEG